MKTSMMKKAIIFGPKGVGKSSVLQRLILGTFSPEYRPTVETTTRVIALGSYELSLADCPGCDKMNQNLFEGFDLGIVVFDTRSEQSYSCVNPLIKQFQNTCPEAQVLVVGTYLDNEIDIGDDVFVPVECKTGYNVDRLKEKIEKTLGQA